MEPVKRPGVHVTSRAPDMQWDQSGLTVQSAVIDENK